VRQRIGGPSAEITAVREAMADGSELVVLGESMGSRGLVPPTPEHGKSMAGAHSWSRYIDAMRGVLTERFRGAIPEPIVLRLGAMETCLAAMRERLEHIEQCKRELLSLESRGHEIRRTMGRAIDTLSQDRSSKERERDRIATEREQIVRARAEALDRANAGDAAASGEADALLWRLAACDELLRDAVLQVEDIEFQLHAIEAQLERLNEGIEHEQDALVAAIQSAMKDVAELDAVLRSHAQALQRAGGERFACG
jgi:hypothetical protein